MMFEIDIGHGEVVNVELDDGIGEPWGYEVGFQCSNPACPEPFHPVAMGRELEPCVVLAMARLRMMGVRGFPPLAICGVEWEDEFLFFKNKAKLDAAYRKGQN